MRRPITRVGLATAAFGAVLAVTFPTDDLARWALARALPSNGPRVTFRRARLRPAGLVLSDAAVHRDDGSVLLAASRLALRPTLAALLRRPGALAWHLDASVCGGRIDALAGASGANVDARALELEGCELVGFPGVVLGGRAGGTSRLRWSGATPQASGSLEVVDPVWDSSLEIPDVIEPLELHAGRARIEWRIDGHRLTVDRLEVRGGEVRVDASGSAEIDPDDPGASRLDLDVRIAPGADAPAPLRRLLARLPTAPDGTHHVVVHGTADAPLVAAG